MGHELTNFPEALLPIKRTPVVSQPVANSAPLTQGDNVTERATAYLRECAPANQGQGGHNSLFWAATAMIHGFNLSENQAYDLLAREYNPRCNPPWELSDSKDYKDFRRKVSEAVKKPCNKPRGWLLQDVTESIYSQADIMALIRESKNSTSTVSEAGNSQATESEVFFRVITASELDAGNYKLKYLVKSLLVADQPCIVAGDKKVLKTSLMLALGIAMSTGDSFLDEFTVYHRVRVGIMTGESGFGTIQETCRRICKAAGRNLADIDGLIFTEDLPKFGDLNYENALRRFILDNKLEVLVVDPAYLCMPGSDAGNLFKQGELLRSVSEICRESGCTLLLAHHTRKNGKVDPFAPPELEDIAWAGFQEFARQWILVGRRKKYEPGTGEHHLWLSVGGSAGHSGLWAVDVSEGTIDDENGRYWNVTVKTGGNAREEAKDRRKAEKEAERMEKEDQRLQDDRKNIVQKMLKYPDGETKSFYKSLTSLNSAYFNKAFASLIDDGFVTPCEVFKGNHKTPYDGFKLVGNVPHE